MKEQRFPVPQVLASAPDVCVAQCCLGMTLYTRHRAPSPSGGVAELLRAFLTVVPNDRELAYRTSLMDRWITLGPSAHEEIVEHVANEKLNQVRHLFGFRLADNTGAAGTFFHYREVDERRGSAGYVQIGLPAVTEARVMTQLAELAADRVPMWSGVGGYLASAHENHVGTSHGVFLRWARRYLGMDIQDPVRARLHGHEGVPSPSWLTLVGRDLFDDTTLAKLARAAGRRPTVRWIDDFAEAVILQAGDAPSLVDTHAMEVGRELGVAHALLAALQPDEPVRLHASFSEGDVAQRWAKRFIEPGAWT